MAKATGTTFTRLGMGGYGIQRAGSFAGKAEADAAGLPKAEGFVPRTTVGKMLGQ